MGISGGRCNQGTSLIEDKKTARMDINRYFRTHPIRMYTIFLHHQAGILVMAMNKGFRSIDFRQLNFGMDFSIFSMVTGEKQMIGTYAESVMPGRQGLQMPDQGKLDSSSQPRGAALNGSVDKVNGRVTEYFRYFGVCRIVIDMHPGAIGDW